jgi:hypothetical protein
VHARLVLLHVPARQEALRRMVSALRPGGWLLVEDYDVALQPLICPDAVTPEQQLANRVKAAFRDAGLAQVRADAYFPLALPAVAALEAANVEQVRGALAERGDVSAADVVRCLEFVSGGELDLATAPLVSAWGRRPAS